MTRHTMHESLRDHGPKKEGTDRAFGCVFAVVFLAIAAFQLYLGRIEWAAGLGAVAFLFVAAAVIKPTLLAPLNRLWLKFGALIHRVTNPLILGLIFFVVFAPMGMVMRLFGFDPLRTRFDASSESYWIERETPGPTPETMTQQF